MNRKTILIALSVLAAGAAPALADGDAAAGEAAFAQCAACHMIADPDGTTIHRGGEIGPNLYGVAGRAAATVDGFRYSSGLRRAAEAGLEWTAEDFAGYVENPTAFLRAYLGDDSLRSPMGFRLGSGAEDIYAYLQGVAD